MDRRGDKIDSSKLRGLGQLGNLGAALSDGLTLGGGLVLGGGGGGSGGLTLSGRGSKKRHSTGSASLSAGSPDRLSPSKGQFAALNERDTPPAPPEPACKFTDAQLDLKVTGCLKEYLSIKSLEEVRLSLGEWGAIERVHTKFVRELFDMAIDGRDGDRAAFRDLLQQIVGKEVKGRTFHAVCLAFLPLVPDLMIESPRAHIYIAELIAAGIDADPKVAGVVIRLAEEPELRSALPGELPLKLALEICAVLQDLQDEARVLELFGCLGITLGQLLDKPDPVRVAELAARAGLDALHYTFAGSGSSFDTKTNSQPPRPTQPTLSNAPTRRSSEQDRSTYPPGINFVVVRKKSGKQKKSVKNTDTQKDMGEQSDVPTSDRVLFGRKKAGDLSESKEWGNLNNGKLGTRGALAFVGGGSVAPCVDFPTLQANVSTRKAPRRATLPTDVQMLTKRAKVKEAGT